MPVKTEVMNRWEVRLDDASLSVNSIDADDKSVKIRLGSVERIISVQDWVALVNAVGTKVKYTAPR